MGFFSHRHTIVIRSVTTGGTHLFDQYEYTRYTYIHNNYYIWFNRIGYAWAIKFKAIGALAQCSSELTTSCKGVRSPTSQLGPFNYISFLFAEQFYCRKQPVFVSYSLCVTLCQVKVVKHCFYVLRFCILYVCYWKHDKGTAAIHS